MVDEVEPSIFPIIVTDVTAPGYEFTDIGILIMDVMLEVVD